jgi:DNA transposition AAA+ family ATPase
MGQKSERRDELRKIISSMLENPVVGLSQNTLADKIGISSSALSQWRRGEYKGSNAEVETKIERFLESYNAGKEYAIELPPDPEWIETPTAIRVWNSIEMAHIMKCLAVVYGAAGSGKTKTLRHYQSQRSNVYLLTAVKAACSVRGLLQEICDVLMISDAGKGNYDLHKKIVKKLSRSGGVFLVDEGQQLTPGALDTLRQIQDEAKIGMVWCGNEPLYTQLTGGFRAPKFAQIFSRILQRTYIESSSDEDVAPIATAMGVTDKASLDYLRQIGVLPGGLRGVVKTIQRAQMAASETGKEIDREMISRAWRTLTNG